MIDPATLDELMSRDPLNLSAQDIDAIIAYQRQYRANIEGGAKSRKVAVDPNAPKKTIDLASLGLAPKVSPAASGLRRRV